MSLEQRVAGEEFDKDAADTPDIAWERPSKPEDDFRRSVVPSRHHRGVVFVLESSGSKVDQTNLRVQKNPSLGGVATNLDRRGWYLSVVGERLISTVVEQDILRLQISVDEIQVVQNCVRSEKPFQNGETGNLQATLVRSCLAKL